MILHIELSNSTLQITENICAVQWPQKNGVNGERKALLNRPWPMGEWERSFLRPKAEIADMEAKWGPSSDVHHFVGIPLKL